MRRAAFILFGLVALLFDLAVMALILLIAGGVQ